MLVVLAIYCKVDKFIYDYDQIIQGQFYKENKKDYRDIFTEIGDHM
jgi:hypothetical protein